MNGYTSTIRKVPEITAVFWIAKLATTAMGEATSDFSVAKINPYIAVLLGGIGLAVALMLQFSARRYIPWRYWLCVAMVAVFGTMAADSLHIQLGIPYIVTTMFFAAALAVIFVAWYKSEKTLSIHSITNPRRELFYWATVLATFALGTAAGDLVAVPLGLGYFSAALAFTAIILIPIVGYYLLRLNEIIAFWFAYVLTRPIGASLADWTSKSKSVGGLNWGNGHVALGLTAAIILLVAYMMLSHSETKRERVRLRT